MHILLIPDSSGTSSKTCLDHRQVLLLGFILVIVLPVLFGLLTYKITSALDRSAAPRLDPQYLAQLEKTLLKQKQGIEEAKQYSETHLNALALRLGKLQAYMMRINALGQRVTAMAGLDKGEFDFSEEPALGGLERVAPLQNLGVPDFMKSLEDLAAEVDRKFEELGLLKALMMDRQLQASLNPVGWPTVGGYVSSAFGGRRDPFTGRPAFHDGVDIANKLNAPVKAMAAGVVTYSAKKAGYGLLVEINHGNDYTTRYAHIRKALVEVGDKVGKGQQIALVGTSGRSTGPHLHFEILRNGRAINPWKRLRASR